MGYYTRRPGATCTVCKALHGWSRGQKDEQPNNAPNPKKQCSCRLSGSIENRAFERYRSTGDPLERGTFFKLEVYKKGTVSQAQV